MGISITSQINQQECGVCVLTSLHNYFYDKEKIDKQKVLDECNLSSSGLSIFDLEVEANKLGLECESYEVRWSEFLDLKLNSYFVILLTTQDNESNHYVIAKKKRGGLEITDSAFSKPFFLKYSELQNRFLGVIILVNKKPNKLFKSTFSKPRTLLLFDLKFVVINILLSLLILLFSLLGARFLNWIIDLAISNKSINNLITLSFIFVFVYFANDLIDYITNIYCSGHLKTYCLLFTNKILSCLSNKSHSFFNKVDKRWMFKIDECVYCISSFCVIEVNRLISNIIFASICLCVIGIMQPYMLIFGFSIPLIQLLFFLFSYRKKKELFVKIIKSENLNSVYYKNLLNSLSNEHWLDRKNNWIKQINNNYSNIYKNFNDSIIFKTNVGLFKNIVRSIVEILIIATCAFLIIKNKSLTIGKLTFLTATLSLYKDCTDGIFGYFLSSIEFNLYWQVYKDITEVSNTKNINQINFKDEITNIEFIANNKSVSLTSKKDNKLNQSILELLKNTQQIKIDHEYIDVDSEYINSNLIICDEKNFYQPTQFQPLFEQNPVLFSKYLRYFKIDLNLEEQSFLKTIVINLLSLTCTRGKIIFIDSILDFFPTADKQMVKEIINKIQLNNSVFIIRREIYD